MANDDIWSNADLAVRVPVPALTLPSTLGPLELRAFPSRIRSLLSVEEEMALAYTPAQ